MQSKLFGDLGSPKYAEYCRDIHESGAYLLGVINDILDMSRIEAGRLQLEFEAVDLDALIEESVRIVNAQADQRDIAVAAEVAPELRLTGDRRAVKQIVLNLLSNAVKFTPGGGSIRVRVRPVGDSIFFTVADTGIGIPNDAIRKLGRPFEQVSNQFTKSHAGSGLGLAVTHRLVTQHGGLIHVDSEPGRGTCIRVSLPVAAPEGD